MKTYQLRLFCDRHHSMDTLDLHPLSQKQPLSDLIAIPKVKVYCDRDYTAQLLSPSTMDVSNMEISLNGIILNSSFKPRTGRITFQDNYYQGKLFTDSYGLSYLTLRFKNSEGYQTFVSETFQIMVRQGPENINVNTMSKYTALHNRFLLYGTRIDYVTRMPDAIDEIPSLEDKVRLLKKTAVLLEKSIRILRTSPKTKAVPVSGRQMLSKPGAAASLMRRPELLCPAPDGKGIRAAGRSLAFDSSRFSASAESTDVYENQVILSFLKAVCGDIARLLPQLDQAAASLPEAMDMNGDYLASSTFLRAAGRTTMNNLREDLSSLQDVYKQIYDAMHRVIPASEFNLTSLPAITPAFRSLPAYRSVFDSVISWMSMKNVGVYDQRFIQIYLQITTMYEVYVLCKLEQFLRHQSFEMISSYRQVYEFESETLYENTTINNVFAFKKEDITITLYYQPVLYDRPHRKNSPVGLFRNTSLSFPKNMGDTARGRYYTPDYILKIEREGCAGAKFILADAKYASFSNIYNYKTIPLIYKYLFSLTPQNPADEISGLYIFQGKSGSFTPGASCVHSLYDLSGDPHSIFPQVEIIALNEYPGMTQKGQFEILENLLSRQIERLKKECPRQEEPEPVQKETVIHPLMLPALIFENYQA